MVSAVNLIEIETILVSISISVKKLRKYPVNPLIMCRNEIMAMSSAAAIQPAIWRIRIWLLFMAKGEMISEVSL
jgi:hypothetical protein